MGVFYKDEIQKKDLSKIRLDSGQTTPLGTNKNDECFTSRQDIINEIINHHPDYDKDLNTYIKAGVLKGKRVISPCDWDAIPEVNGQPVKATRSETRDGWIKLEYKHVETDNVVEDEKTFKELKKLLTEGSVDTVQHELINWTKCNFVLTFLSLLARGDIESLTFSGYNPMAEFRVIDEYEWEDTPEGKREVRKKIKELEKLNSEFNYEVISPHEENGFKWRILEGIGAGVDAFDIDYSEYDLVVTNPPFSLYDGLLKKWLSYEHLDVILLAPFLNRVAPNVGLPLWLGQNPEYLPYQWGKTEEDSYKKGLFLGFGRKIRMSFENPTYLTKSKLVAVDWVTTFNFVQKQIDKNKRLTNNIQLGLYKNEFAFYENILMKDGTRPIRINNFRGIPDDYYGWFIAAIGILDVLSNEEFEWYGTNYQGFFNSEMGREITPISHKHTNTMLAYGRELPEMWEISSSDVQEYVKDQGLSQGFHGILARRKDSMIPSNKTREQLTNEYKQWYEDFKSGTVSVNFINKEEF